MLYLFHGREARAAPALCLGVRARDGHQHRRGDARRFPWQDTSCLDTSISLVIQVYEEGRANQNLTREPTYASTEHGGRPRPARRCTMKARILRVLALLIGACAKPTPTRFTTGGDDVAAEPARTYRWSFDDMAVGSLP